MRKFLINSFFFFSLMPFVSPLPIGSDVQPVSAILAFILLFWAALERNFRLTTLTMTFLALAIFSLIYAGFDTNNLFELRHRVGLVFASITFIALIYYLMEFSKKILMLAIVVNFFGVVWHFFLPDSFIVIGELFVREIKQTAGGRGASGFAAESSFTAITAMVQFLITYFYYLKEKVSKQFLIWSFFLCLAIILITGSGTGVIYTTILFAIFTISRLSLKSIILISIVSPILVFLFLNSSISENTRGGFLLKLLITNPSILLIDGSISERLLSLEIGLRSLQEYPLGKGGGSYSETAIILDEKYSIISKYTNYGISPARANAYLFETVSSFARYTIELGFLFVLFLVFLFTQSYSLNNFSLISLTLALLLILVSFSILFPPTYLLLAASYSLRNNNVKLISDKVL